MPRPLAGVDYSRSATTPNKKLLGQRRIAWSVNRKFAELQAGTAILIGHTSLGIWIVGTVASVRPGGQRGHRPNFAKKPHRARTA